MTIPYDANRNLTYIAPTDVENETEKSVFARQTMYEAMRQGFSVDLFTNGYTTDSFVRPMETMNLRSVRIFRMEVP
jgi:archaellum biogenesis ATPase FlaH